MTARPLDTQVSSSVATRPTRRFHTSHYVSLATQSVLTNEGSILARVAIMDYRGGVLLDLLSRPTAVVTDYNTRVTGLRPEHFAQSDIVADFSDVRRSAAIFLADRLIVGFETWTSLNLLKLSHPAMMTRDIATYMPFRPDQQDSSPDTFPMLVQKYLRREIRGGLVNPVEDGRAAMDLFRCSELQWEEAVARGVWPCFLPPEKYSQCYT